MLTYDKGKAEKTALAVFQHPNLGYPYDAGWYFYKVSYEVNYFLIEYLHYGPIIPGL